MTIYDYRTAEAIRPATEAEDAAYRALLAVDTTHTGAVDSDDVAEDLRRDGHSRTVYFA